MTVNTEINGSLLNYEYRKTLEAEFHHTEQVLRCYCSSIPNKMKDRQREATDNLQTLTALLQLMRSVTTSGVRSGLPVVRLDTIQM